MGNLFSGSNQARRRQNEAEETRRQLILEAELGRQRRLEILRQQERQRQQERLRQLEEQRRISAIQQLHVNLFTISRAGGYNSEAVSRTPRNFSCSLVITNYLTNYTSDWAPMTSNDTVKYVDLLSNSQEYMEIAQMFRSTNKRFFKVSRIERIQNPCLYAAYLLKKEELTSRLGSPEEKLLFHGTKKHNLDDICEDNFDWRLHGKGTGHRFGKGVSFSPISNYATHYCDKYLSIKVMLVVKVLISRLCVGNADMIIPPNGFDTTAKRDGHVIVKYYDNEYYPAYKLYFTQVGSDI